MKKSEKDFDAFRPKHLLFLEVLLDGRPNLRLHHIIVETSKRLPEPHFTAVAEGDIFIAALKGNRLYQIAGSVFLTFGRTSCKGRLGVSL